MIENIITCTPMYVTFFWALILLLTYNQNNKAKFFLGIFMSVAFFLYLSHAIFFHENIGLYQYFDPVYIFSTLAVYPLYYLYIRLLTADTNYRLSYLNLLTPAIILSAASLIIYLLMDSNERDAYIRGFLLDQEIVLSGSLLIQLQKLVYIAVRIVFAIQVFIVVVQGRKLVTEYNLRISNFYSNLESKNMLWVNIILYSLLATALMSITFNVIGRSIFIDSRDFLLIPSFIFSVLLFLIGYAGSIQNHTVSDLENESLGSAVPVMKRFNDKHLATKLINLFEMNHAYKNSELKITDVAQLLGTNRTYISELINSEFSCSFVDFVNSYRHKEVKRLMHEKDPEHFSLHEISEHSGFGSIGTFIRVFKQYEGVTPGKYREMIFNSNTAKIKQQTST